MYEPACRHIASALLPWYLNGVLHADEHAMVRDHVEGCDVCATELEDLEASVRAARRPDYTSDLPAGAVPIPAEPRSQGWGSWILAIVLAVPAILGLVWVILGVTRGR